MWERGLKIGRKQCRFDVKNFHGNKKEKKLSNFYNLTKFNNSILQKLLIQVKKENRKTRKKLNK